MAQHAILSASGAHRWLHCMPSAVLEAQFPDEGSTFAREGSLAHAYCAKNLKTMFGMPYDDETAEIAELSPSYTEAEIAEMKEYAAGYFAMVAERVRVHRENTPDLTVLVEQKVDFSHIVPDGFGTADCLIIADGVMEVIDFKYGKGVRVDAPENPQMMLYALGAYEAEGYRYDIDTIRMTIYQPRLAHVSDWEISSELLLERAYGEIAPKARIAAIGGGAFESGAWCRFCKIRPTCRRYASDMLDTWGIGTGGATLTPEEIAESILPRLADIKAWASAVEEDTLKNALAGTQYPGYKLVEGRSVRKIFDAPAAINALSQAGVAEEFIFKPKEMLGITALEKGIGKKRFGEICGDYIAKAPGKPTLVEESDRRQALDPTADFD